jgi:hypothetical protein
MLSGEISRKDSLRVTAPSGAEILTFEAVKKVPH